MLYQVILTAQAWSIQNLFLLRLMWDFLSGQKRPFLPAEVANQDKGLPILPACCLFVMQLPWLFHLLLKANSFIVIFYIYSSENESFFEKS